MVERDARGLDLLDEVEYLVRGVHEGLKLRDLAADVAVDARDGKARQFGRAQVARKRRVKGDAELVVLEARRNVGMGLGVDVGIDAQRHAGDLAYLNCHAVEAL